MNSFFLRVDGFKVYSTLAEIPPDLCFALHLLFIHLLSKNLSRTYYVQAFYIQEMMRRKKKKRKRKSKKKRKKIPSALWNLHSLHPTSHSLLSFSLLFALSLTSVSKLFGTILLLPHPQCVKPPYLAPTSFTSHRICS